MIGGFVVRECESCGVRTKCYYFNKKVLCEGCWVVEKINTPVKGEGVWGVSHHCFSPQSFSKKEVN